MCHSSVFVSRLDALVSVSSGVEGATKTDHLSRHLGCVCRRHLFMGKSNVAMSAKLAANASRNRISSETIYFRVFLDKIHQDWSSNTQIQLQHHSSRDPDRPGFVI